MGRLRETLTPMPTSSTKEVRRLGGLTRETTKGLLREKGARRGSTYIGETPRERTARPSGWPPSASAITG